MGYENFDHAGWVQDRIDFLHQQKPDKHPRLPKALSRFQRKVCNIVGIVGKGIHNAPVPPPEKIDWDYGGGVSVLWSRDLSTWDFNELTDLVFLCHEARIRCTVEPCNPRYLRITFYQRAVSDSISKRHPSLDEAVADMHRRIPTGHQILYSSDMDAPPSDV